MGLDWNEKSGGEVGYRSFLLRLWRVDTKEKLAWRFSLENSVTGERKEFANLGELLVFLLDEVSDRQYDDYGRALIMEMELGEL
ncbi:MAG: hypothetical protein KAI06_08105 [Anaerolineales bacterium]|nr:hypothetical protein [Anaerolineales bacterium]